MDKIFVSIASYMDLELTQTVFSALSQSKDPSRLFFSVFSQDIDSEHPKLENLFDMFNVYGFDYKKISYVDAKGVGFARAKAQESLTSEFKYYIQVDSHTQFIENWDEKLIKDYIDIENFWKDRIILSSYPGTYVYNESGNIQVSSESTPTCLRVQPSTNKDIVFEPKYTTYYGDDNGAYHGYFCAGFVFGRSEYFIEVPYDPHIYFNGEEQTLSIRFFCNDIKIIAPKNNYVYHHYTGTKRSRHWESTPGWVELDEKSKERLRMFFAGDSLDGFGIKDYSKYLLWVNCFITQPEDPLV